VLVDAGERYPLPTGGTTSEPINESACEIVAAIPAEDAPAAILSFAAIS
jgi:hypothetical protein